MSLCSQKPSPSHTHLALSESFKRTPIIPEVAPISITEPDSESDDPEPTETDPVKPPEQPAEVLTPLSDATNSPTDDRMDSPAMNAVGNGKPPTATLLTVGDEDEVARNKKSCLSLPVEPLSGQTLPVHHDRRKLSVQGLMVGLADRRRSSGAFLSELTRKMSITHSDGFSSRSPGAGYQRKMTKYVECWGADKPFANIKDSMAKNVGLAVRELDT